MLNIGRLPVTDTDFLRFLELSSSSCSEDDGVTEFSLMSSSSSESRSSSESDTDGDDDGDGDYIPGRRGVDDDDDDEDDFEEEDEDEDLDRQLDAEDAAEAMEDLHNIVEAEQEGERTTIAQLLQSSGALPTAALYP